MHSSYSLLRMATRHLAVWVSRLQFSDLPEKVVHAAIRSYYNWAGCAIGGSQHPAATIAVLWHSLELGTALESNTKVVHLAVAIFWAGHIHTPRSQGIGPG